MMIIRVCRTLPVAMVAMSVCIAPSVRAAGLDDLDVTIQVIEHREQGAGEIINRIELPRPPSAAVDAGRSDAHRESGDADHADVDHSVKAGASASAISGDIRQQSASARENTHSVRGHSRDVSNEVRSDSVQNIEDTRGNIRSSVQDSSSEIRSSARENSHEIRSSVQDTSSEIKDAAHDSVSDVKDQSSVNDVRENAADRELEIEND